MHYSYTSMAVTQPQNVQRGVAPIDPITVPNVVRVMYYRSPYPKTLDLFTAPSSTPGDLVMWCSDRQAVLGGDPYDDQSVPINSPTFQADGLQFSTDINNKLAISNAPVNAGLTAFTMYLWGTQVDNNDSWVPLGNTNDQTFIIIGGNTVNVQDDAGGASLSFGGAAGGKILLRLDFDGATLSAQCTGNSTGMSVSAAASVFTFNCVGQAPNISNPNADTGNRHLGQIIVPQNTLGSQTDLGLRQWITDLDGTAYSL